MPQEVEITQEIEEAYKAAVARGTVRIYTKGFRPMFKIDYPYGFNDMDIGGGYWLPMPIVCKLAGIDPQLIQDVYFGYKQREISGNYLNYRLLDEIWEQRKQMVTNLLPFQRIEWRREWGEGGSTLLSIVERKPLSMDIEAIRALCEPNSE
jgi:hypothetical protein